MSQVAQELQSRVKGTHALKILQIYLPEKAGEGVGLKSKQEKTRTEAPNQLLDVVDLLRRTVDSRAQEVVVRALEDCKSLRDLGEKLLVCNQTRNSHNRGVKALQVKSSLFFSLSLTRVFFSCPLWQVGGVAVVVFLSNPPPLLSRSF